MQKYPPEDQEMLIPFFEKQAHSFDTLHKRYEDAEATLYNFNSEANNNVEFSNIGNQFNLDYGACYENLIDNSYFDAAAYSFQFVPDTVTDGVNYLTVWWDYRPFYEKPYNWNVWGTLTDENGQAITKYGIKINTNSNPKFYPKVAFNGERYIAIWVEGRDIQNKGTGIYGTFVTRDGVVVNPDGFEIVDNVKPYWEWDADLACSQISKTCLISWYNFIKGSGYQIAARFIYADGSLSDIIEISNIGPFEAYPYVSYAYKDGIEKFLITWNKYDAAYGMRVRIDGTREDWPNGIEIAPNLTAYPKSEFDGRRFLIIWWDFRRADGYDSDVYGKYLEPNTGHLSPEILISDGINTAIEPQLAYNGNFYLLTWPSLYMLQPAFGMDIMGVRVDDQGNKSGIFTINSSYLFQSYPLVAGKSIASNDSLFLVSWWDRRNSFETSGEQSDIYYSRVKISSSGAIEVLDADGLLADISINHQRYPSIAKGEGNYLVVWEDNRPKDPLKMGEDLDLYGRILDANGKPVGDAFAIFKDKNYQGLPAISYNPDPDWKKFMLIWQDMSQYYRWNSDFWISIVNPDGTLGPSHIIYQSTNIGDLNKAAIATADVYPYNSLAAFKVAYPSQIKAVLLNSHGNIIKNIVLKDNATANKISMIWNGENFFVVFDGISYIIVDIQGNTISQGYLTPGAWPDISYIKDLGLQFISYECSGKICGIFTDKLGNIKYPPGIIEIKNYAGYNFLPFSCSKGNEVLVGWQNDEIGAYPNNLYYAKVDADGNVTPLNGEMISPRISFHTHGVCESKDEGYIILSEAYYEELKDTVRVSYYYLEDLKINSIDPAQGCANCGFYVTIIGTGFKEGAKVFFGTIESEDVQVQDCNQIKALVPPYNEYQLVDVKVVNPTGEQAVLPNAFNYGSLVTINLISPRVSPRTGGVSVIVTGTDFTAQSIIRLRATLKDGSEWIQDVVPTYEPPDKLIFISPMAPEPLIAELCVINPDCGEVCVAEGIAYYDGYDFPFSPHIGITAGETPVTFWMPAILANKACCAKFDGIRSNATIVGSGQVVVKTPIHFEDIVNVEMCFFEFGEIICYPQTTPFEFSTFAYVTGQKAYIEVVDTYLDELVDFKPYVPGIQSRIEFSAPIASTSFSRNKIVAGRYAYAAMTTAEEFKVLKIHTGSSEVVSEFVLKNPMLSAGDVAVALFKPAGAIPPSDAYHLIVGTNHLQIAGYFGGVLILDPDTMELKQSLSIPELSLGQILNIAVDGNAVYLSTLIGPIQGPQQQLLVTLKYVAFPAPGEWIVECSLDNLANINYPTPVGLANLGLATIYDPELDCQQLCLVVPEYDFADFQDGALACSSDTCSSFDNIIPLELDPNKPRPYPQDVTIGKIIADPYNPDITDWKAFVVDSATDKWTRINGLCTANIILNEPKDVYGKTPVATEIRSSYDKVYVVNMNSSDDPILNEHDLSIIDPINNILYEGITGIEKEFHPNSISIQKVLKAIDFLEAARQTLYLMEDADFSTPSKRQVLLNRLDAIENLLGTPANNEAIISNTEAFQNQVDNFVVNEARKEELLIYSEVLIKSVQN